MGHWKLIGIGLLATATLSTSAARQPGEIAEQNATKMTVSLIKVDDGDSFAAYDDDGNRHRVRLAAIDAPEHKQAHGPVAGEHLKRLLSGASITLYVRKKDRYRRLVARVVVNGQNVGLSLVRSGYAWHFKRFAHEQPAPERALFEAAQASAREASLGLWRANDPTPPWQWRRENRKKR